MNFYYIVTKNLVHGITAKVLSLGYDQAKLLAYYLDASADEYYQPTQVFENYDDALAAFCTESAKQLAYHKAQIALIEEAKDRVLES
jgi:hypothetical protein